MSKLLYNLKGYTKIFYWIFVFFITAALLFLILPGESKFKYEYQKGFPWRHENLVAPFDFAILKTPEKIEEERLEQLQSVLPYFSVDTSVYNTQ
ncbi:MAG: transmembrane HD family protein, partial [Prolixibacteraceae bacterium]